jgi:hypothetical protein
MAVPAAYPCNPLSLRQRLPEIPYLAIGILDPSQRAKPMLAEEPHRFLVLQPL